jgi:hypothetical protein
MKNNLIKTKNSIQVKSKNKIHKEPFSYFYFVSGLWVCYIVKILLFNVLTDFKLKNLKQKTKKKMNCKNNIEMLKTSNKENFFSFDFNYKLKYFK